jgi:hypothetical protein
VFRQTRYDQQNKYGNVELADFKRLKDLEEENAESKRGRWPN